MHRGVTLLVAALAASVSALVLLMDAWPGDNVLLLIYGFFFDSWSLPVLIVAPFVGAVALGRQAHAIAQDPEIRAIALPSAAVVLIALSITIVATGFHLPRRAAFLASRAHFEAQLRSQATSPERVLELNASLGLYAADRIGRDARGGVYLRTSHAPNGLGPDRMSYGFTYHPNPEGSPFGNANYEIDHVVDGWYMFQASDDR